MGSLRYASCDQPHFKAGGILQKTSVYVLALVHQYDICNSSVVHCLLLAWRCFRRGVSSIKVIQQQSAVCTHRTSLMNTLSVAPCYQHSNSSNLLFCPCLKQEYICWDNATIVNEPEVSFLLYLWTLHYSYLLQFYSENIASQATVVEETTS